MLINLSNHPSIKWGNEQTQAANKTYRSIADIPFPVIEPSATIESVLELAAEYVEKCMDLFQMHQQDSKANDCAVHVMGEMTFTYNVVRYLSHKGINAVASTTERVAVEEENGQKISVFVFKQFRCYHSIFEIPF